MVTCTPFLLFDGNCAEAMTFYHECLGGDLTLTKLVDTPMKAAFPAEKHDRIINAHIKSGLIEISATDWMASPERDPQYGNIFAIFVQSDSQDELKTIFDKLSTDAQKDGFQELHEMPFGMFGQFYDKYGYQWIFRGENT